MSDAPFTPGATSAESRPPDLHVRFGTVDVATSVRGLTAQTSIQDLPRAEFLLDLEALPEGSVVDYLSEVEVTAVWEGVESPLFTGVVVSATPTQEGIAIECRGGMALVEELLPPMAYSNLRAADVIYLITRSVGFTDERLSIDGLDELPSEPFEVLVPVTGAAPVEGRYDIGPVRFVDRNEAESFLFHLPSAHELRARFLEGQAFALTCVSASTAYDAEQNGLANIDVSLAWLAARARYGLARLPNQERLTFRRTDARSRPRRAQLVCARGLKSMRRWVRSLEPSLHNGGLSLRDSRLLNPSLADDLTFQDRQALLACLRAATDQDPLGAVTALWDALEFLVAGTTLSPLFAPALLESIRESLPDSLSDAQRARALDAIAGMNTPPLITRLRAALSRDGIPVSEGEITLLLRLRKLRNDAVHGRRAELPSAEDLQHALAVISRMLVYRIHLRQQRS